MVLLLGDDGGARQVNAAFSDLTGIAAPQALGDGWQRALLADSREPLLAALRRARATSACRCACAVPTAACRLARLHGALAARCRLLRLPAARRDHAAAPSGAEPGGAVPAAGRQRAGADRLLRAPTTCSCRFANKAYARSFGRDEQSIIGQTFAEIIGEEAAREIAAAGRAHAASRRRGRSPTSASWPAPTARRAGSRSTCCRTSTRTARALGAFVLISDITRHRAAEQALRESRGAAGQVHAGQRRGHRVPPRRPHHRRQPAAVRSCSATRSTSCSAARRSTSSRPTSVARVAAVIDVGPGDDLRERAARQATASASRSSSSCARWCATASRCA